VAGAQPTRAFTSKLGIRVHIAQFGKPLLCWREDDLVWRSRYAGHLVPENASPEHLDQLHVQPQGG